MQFALPDEGDLDIVVQKSLTFAINDASQSLFVSPAPLQSFCQSHKPFTRCRRRVLDITVIRMAKKGKGGGRGGGRCSGGGRGGGGQNAGVSTGGSGVGCGPPDNDAPSSSIGISEQEKKSAINGDFGTLNELLEILLMSHKYKDLEDLFTRRIEEAKEKQSQLEQKITAAERELFDLENLAKQQQADETTKSEGEERQSLIAELVKVEDGYNDGRKAKSHSYMYGFPFVMGNFSDLLGNWVERIGGGKNGKGNVSEANWLGLLVIATLMDGACAFGFASEGHLTDLKTLEKINTGDQQVLVYGIMKIGSKLTPITVGKLLEAIFQTPYKLRYHEARVLEHALMAVQVLLSSLVSWGSELIGIEVSVRHEA
ncbi:hypothetical protein RJ640_026522 [Escallonia rubra]|uniref:Uncharacterized protein n=1 Tax=Escallonia rubra TaxID=112253 RepID=A0AA88UGR7_9ASTE|nr:hypothetical protein RJ640_026522 [Escallonia rubra]